MELISVIVPVYNVEKYIDKCIESIVSQTYRELEIILVDDGATDSSGEKCDLWKEKDNRIKVIHKENGGLSDARNTGIKAASGKYISFIDSDDRINGEMYEILIKTLKDTESDATGCTFFRTSEENSEFPSGTGKIMSFEGEAIQAELIKDKLIQQVVWNKLYKTELISDIPFEKGKCNEDEFWSYLALGKCRKYSTVDYCGYAYLQRSDSIMGNNYSLKRLDAVEAKARRVDYIAENYPSLTNEALKNLFFACTYHGQTALKQLSKADRKTAMKILSGTVKKYRMPMRFVLHLPISDILCQIVSKISFTLCCKIRNILKKGL